MENKLNTRHERQRVNSIRPTKFQLLQSRFMNNNRESYRKKTREVGKLVIKEKSSANRNGLSSIVSKFERKSLAEESSLKTSQEKVKWVGSCGKNTVKNILKKFIEAEEKELKEKEQLTPKKKALNNSLPKIINKNSVLSKLKEKFEQTSNICSTIEVKALLPCTGEKKSKKGPEKKAVRKAQIKELKADLRTTTHFNGPQPQQVVGTTAPTPKFCVATEISHPWSWATNAKCSVQRSDYNTEAVETTGSQKPQHIWPGGNRTPEGTAYEGQQEGQLQNKQGEMPKVVTDDKDTVENNVISGSPGGNLDSLPPSCESQSPAGCIPTLSKDSVRHKKNVIPPVFNVFSSSGKENPAEIISKEHLSTTCPPCSPTERPCAPSYQEIKRDEIPGILEGICRPKETEIELAEPIRDPPFASQKSFPEQKLVDNIPPAFTPVAQASCNRASPGTDDLQSSVEPPAVDNMPPIKSIREAAPDCRRSFSDAVQNREKLPQQKETFPNPTKQDHASILKQKEPRPERGQGKPPDGRVESELLPQKPHSQQSNKDTSRPGISMHTQANQAPTSNSSQKEKTDHQETKMCRVESEKHLSPVSSDLVVSSCATAIENTDRCKSPSVNEIPNPENENESEMNQVDTTQVLLENIINHELHNAEENSRPAAEKCHSSSLDYSGKPVSHTAEVNRPWCGIGKFQKPSSLESIKKESYGKDNKVAIPNSETLHLPSPNELLKPKGIPGGDNKSTHNLPSCNDVNNNENNAAEDKGARPQTEKHQQPSAKELEKHANSTAGVTSPLTSLRKSQMPLVNKSGKQENKKVLAEEKPQESNLPSQNEMLMQECNSDAGKRKTQKAAAQPEVPSTVDRRDQEGERAGGKSPTVESKKMVPSSKTAQKSITNILAKDGDGNTTENSITQTLQLTPSKHKANSPGVLNSPLNAKYQTISKDPAQHGGVKAGDENTMKKQRSPLKAPVRQESDGEGRNAKDSLVNGKMSLPGTKVKSESKTGKKQDNSSNSGQSQLPVKNGLPKRKQNSARETNTVDNLKKDQKLPSKELKTEQTNPAVEKPREMSLCDSGKPRGTPKGEKDAPGNCLLSVPDVKWESLQNKAEKQMQQKQQPQLSKAYVKTKTGIRDEKHQHCHSERHHLPSSNDMEMQAVEMKAVENKSALDNSEKCRAPMLKHDRPLSQKKVEDKIEAQPKLGSSDKTPPAEQKSTQHSASKYQILSSWTTSRSRSEDAQTSGAGGMNENKTRTKLGSLDKASPTEQKSTQRSASKYQILSSRTASGPGSEDTQKYGAGGINENKARLVNLDKYIAESYSEEPTHTSFKPIVIRAIDTIKLDN